MIGVIADDVTGATDVAAALTRAGLRTLLSMTADMGDDSIDADAVVIGLKTRSVPIRSAVALSVMALASLKQLGADRFYLKYCSTFDSTAEGNIGPVTEALAALLGVQTVVTTPAAPLHGRTVYQGHLFVGGSLLHETHMRDHPVTPMRDSSVIRLLEPQVSGGIGLLTLEAVRAGTGHIRQQIQAAEGAGLAHLVVDAVVEDDLAAVAESVDSSPLVSGSVGLIAAMALRQPSSELVVPTPPPGRTALIAGSCSRRTLEQIGRFREEGWPSYRLTAASGETAQKLAERALSWWDEQPTESSALIYSSSEAGERDPSAPHNGAIYEETAGLIAAHLAANGIRRMLIAGGETSGAVIKALGIQVAVVGEEVAPGSPWVHDTRRDLHLVLKSGNFGSVDLFVDIARSGSTA